MRASETDRALACPHSLVALRLLPRRTASDVAADYGHVVHAWKETGAVANGPAGELLERKLLESGHGVNWSRDTVWPAPGRHEVTFAVDLHSARTLWYDGSRDGADAWKASFGWEFLTGTADYVHPDDARGLDWTDDLKTSRAEYTVTAARSGQLKSYALATWCDRGRPADYGHHVTITNWAKYPLGAPPSRTSATLSALDLEDHLEALRAAVADPESAVMGEHCTFCDAREPHAMTPLMQHWRHRALPACARGLAAAAQPVL